MRYKSLLVAAALTIMAALLPLFPFSASASSPAPTISSFSPTQGPVGTTVTVEGTNLAHAKSVSFGQTRAKVIVDTSTEVKVRVPTGATTSAVDVMTRGGFATSASHFVVTAALGDVVSVVSVANTNCAVLTSGGVDCWGHGQGGELGNGVFYTSANHYGSAVAVPVLGVGGSGTLSGVVSLASGGDYAGGGSNYCALLTSGGVDCWGGGYYGQLGDGVFYTTGHKGSAVPVAVLGVGGSGTLGGVLSLATDDNYRGSGYCALLATGGVDCWGYDYFGALGDNSTQSRAVPVAVLGVGDSGTLGGAVSLAGDALPGYCALLVTGGVDCWGGFWLGNGTSGGGGYGPVAVVGIGSSGTLGGVVDLVSDGSGYCALLAGGGVDCWGDGDLGQLGDGSFYGGEPQTGSNVPVEVLGVGGSGTLSGVVSLASIANDAGYGYCSVVTSGEVDCWGYGYNGQLGNGIFYNNSLTTGFGSDVPVAVLGVGGSGTLAGTASLASDERPAGSGYCAVLTWRGVDCWGYGYSGQLGDGIRYKKGLSKGSAFPVAVLGVGGRGTLGSVTKLVGYNHGFCSVLTSGRVDCWGAGVQGQLGNGVFEISAVPVAVAAAITS